MNILDLIIVILAIVALFRGRSVGFIRQVILTIGFLGGLLIGAWIGPKFLHFTNTALSRSLLTLFITLGVALIFLSIAGYVSEVLKHRIQTHKISKLEAIDRMLGSVVGIITLLGTVWLGAAVLIKLPYPNLQNDLRGSTIITYLNANLPQTPTVVADLGHIIDPNGFPEVFIGAEPSPGTAILPPLGDLKPAVIKDESSVVKIEGQGCGGIVEGSGFVAANNLVLTNAHVVAGISQPYVIDQKGQYQATPIWFDPNLDLAVLEVKKLGLPPLNIDTAITNSGTTTAVLGYPSEGPFRANPASVIDEFTALGRNIYGRGSTQRNVYEIKATVVPGNSGGPLINVNGSVIGIVFAQSTVYNQVGYALTTQLPLQELYQAEAIQHPASTGTCAK
jgi:S1-C subfamily serine protease